MTFDPEIPDLEPYHAEIKVNKNIYARMFVAGSLQIANS